jgi:hypothetical protein
MRGDELSDIKTKTSSLILSLKDSFVFGQGTRFLPFADNMKASQTGNQNCQINLAECGV